MSGSACCIMKNRIVKVFTAAFRKRQCLLHHEKLHHEKPQDVKALHYIAVSGSEILMLKTKPT